MKCSKKRIVFDTEKLAEIKEAITKSDMRVLIEQGVISKIPERGISRSRARFGQQQKMKDKRKGHGSRKGAAGARTNRKTAWVNRVRLQRRYLQGLREGKTVTQPEFVELYKKIKGGFFRSKRHMELYLTEKGILKGSRASTPQNKQDAGEAK